MKSGDLVRKKCITEAQRRRRTAFGEEPNPSKLYVVDISCTSMTTLIDTTTGLKYFIKDPSAFEVVSESG